MAGSDETDPEVLADAEAVDADWSLVEDEYPPDGPVPAPLDGPLQAVPDDPPETEEVEPEWMPPQPPLGASSLFDLGALGGWQSGSFEYVSPPEPPAERRTRRGPPRVPTGGGPAGASPARPQGGAPAGAPPIGSRLRARRAPPEPEPAPARAYPRLLAKLTGGAPLSADSRASGGTSTETAAQSMPTQALVPTEPPAAGRMEDAPIPPSADRTFFPAPKFPPVVPDAPIGRDEYVEGASRSGPTVDGDRGRTESPADLDGLLTEMAEGLLIGTSPTGGTQVRLTLNDDFLAGTEIVIEVKEKKVHAEFIPPDRETYWRIEPESARLQQMLEARGLRVQELSVRFPPL